MAGRGAYYKNLYGGGGRGRGGRGRGGRGGSSHPQDQSPPRKRQRNTEEIRTSQELVSELHRINGKSYPAYHDIEGTWHYDRFLSYVDHVQSDPFAPPSKLRLHMQHDVAKFPQSLYCNTTRSIALCDFLTRAASSINQPSSSSKNWHGSKGGDITLDRPGQQVLQRSSVVINSSGIEARFTLGLPAQGRTVLGDRAADIFRNAIPRLADRFLFEYHNYQELLTFVDSIEDQENLRDQLKTASLSAFIINGAILPRASGASDLPLTGPGVVRFESPPDLERSFILPHRGEVRGMGIPQGITLIAGGGFHGKSTILDALAVGCYNHVPGDGREFVVTSPMCVSAQGEDGRSIKNVDIRPFINNLPGGTSTSSFSTQDASGSTSMAAGVIEALELGADTILFDEDTCATNFLIRDRRMQMLVSADPITPLIFKIRSMYRDHGCSSILVIGGCGDYCDVADLVLEMRNYECHNITDAARRVAEQIPSVVRDHEETSFGQVRRRVISPRSLLPSGAKTVARGRTTIQIGEESLDLTRLMQLVHESQTRAIVSILQYLVAKNPAHKKVALVDCLDSLQASLDSERGLDEVMVEDRIDGFLARPRLFEVGMAINRLRSAALQYNNKMDNR